MLIVTELHYHRNGVFGAGYYAAKAEWRVNDGDVFRVMAVVFDADEHIAILADGDIGTSFRYEDFARDLRAFINSRGGQVIAFPHMIAKPQAEEARPPVRFETGSTYSCRSICDHDCIFTFQVVKRTENTITIWSKSHGFKRRKVRLYDGIEEIDPLGRYSMAPVLRADKAA